MLPELKGEPLLLPLGDGIESLGTLAPLSKVSSNGQHRFVREGLFETSVVSMGSTFVLFSCSNAFSLEETALGADQWGWTPTGMGEMERGRHLLSCSSDILI